MPERDLWQADLDACVLQWQGSVSLLFGFTTAGSVVLAAALIQEKHSMNPVLCSMLLRHATPLHRDGEVHLFQKRSVMLLAGYAWLECLVH